MKKPTLRFKGFAEEWVSKTLNEASTYIKSGKNRERVVSGMYPVYGSTGIIGSCNNFQYEGESILIARVGANAGHLNLVNGKYDVSDNTLILRLSKDNNQFVKYKLDFWNLNRLVFGSGQPLITAGQLKNVEIAFAASAEQAKIASFFMELDSLIEGKRAKLDKLKKLKLAYLGKMFPKKGSRIPEIRFKGFSGDWNKKRLGNVGNSYTGLSGKGKKDFGHGGASYVTYMNVFSNPIATLEQTDRIEVDKKQNCVKKNDVFFTVSSETPEEVGMSSVWTYDKENVYLNSFCFGFRPCENVDPYYFAYLMRSPIERNQIILLAQGISRFNISKTKMMDISVLLPSLPEQQKIGAFFQNLDILINLQQQELDKLSNIKSACLSKMFA